MVTRRVGFFKNFWHAKPEPVFFKLIKKAGSGSRNKTIGEADESAQMLRDKLGHFKHVDGTLSTENGLKCGICIDIALVRWILQIVFLNVLPQFLRGFGTWKRLSSHNFCKVRARLQRFHKCWIRLSGHSFLLSVSRFSCCQI